MLSCQDKLVLRILLGYFGTGKIALDLVRRTCGLLALPEAASSEEAPVLCVLRTPPLKGPLSGALARVCMCLSDPERLLDSGG